jgi:16S rRNA A1518/A1519 N6-dimethyltransferase RsmA/KsgA/DIM1 with predicted DNA glycosylase/AP lyase activity
MISILKGLFPEQIEKKQFELIDGDILKVPLPEYDRCIANIPYYVF